MKKTLLFTGTAFTILLLYTGYNVNGQEALFSEDFSGFTTGTHSSPATNDISGALDLKTRLPGWTGSKIYSAGGEIKLGTSSIPGWIETPLINLSGCTGELSISFDICSWPDDAATVRIFLNGIQLCNDLTPSNDSRKIKIPITTGTVSGKFKFESQTKRFFLDNVLIAADGTTRVWLPDQPPLLPGIYPNPSRDVINISNIEGVNLLEISDIYGRLLKVLSPRGESELVISLDGMSSGIYMIRFSSRRGWLVSKFIVEKNMH